MVAMIIRGNRNYTVEGPRKRSVGLSLPENSYPQPAGSRDYLTDSARRSSMRLVMLEFAGPKFMCRTIPCLSTRKEVGHPRSPTRLHLFHMT